ncbi:hypothetical protein JZO66_07155 [Enterococcus sp. DIV0242_7C1]|uniref:MFS transporter n=1 Tax=Candidatus Enterococcus dunnyi TaxID=1834192 RepID=A0A200IZB5_9ENTE|nr:MULTISPECIES: hypothetical protein [unclassified Enterococcus]MBO0470318.1 hypothetical protein [Enterococcus sp. DIV0242_7C1]OUZ30313.1 hypothetical protein A5889_002601 [Enterococcus sp. 9D6_DIV0238]
MTKLKEIALSAVQVAPFILANTLIIIPYFLFLNLNDGLTWEKALPFVLFYTFRMTGIFLLKSFKLALTSFNVLIISILIGGIGCFIGVLGQIYFPAYLLAAVLIGLSASWLPAANTTVNYHEKYQGHSTPIARKYVFILLILGGIVASLTLTKEWRTSLVLGEYVLLYASAYYAVRHYPDYEIDFNEVDQQVISVKEFFLFISFFILLLFIRSARLLFDSQLLDIGIIGFSVLFVIAAWYLNRQRKAWKLPLWLNLLTFANGMCMNFLMLFGTLYVALRLGANGLLVNLYLPYVLGIIGAAAFIKLLYRLFSTVDPKIVHLGSYIVSLMFLLSSTLFPVGIFLLSCTINATGAFLNRNYYQDEMLPQDQRIITKYSTQTKGSVTHQLLMMSLMWILARQEELPVKTVLQITGHRTASLAAVHLVETVHVISLIGLMLFFLIIGFIVIKDNSGTKIEQNHLE